MSDKTTLIPGQDYVVEANPEYKLRFVGKDRNDFVFYHYQVSMYISFFSDKGFIPAPKTLEEEVKEALQRFKEGKCDSEITWDYIWSAFERHKKSELQ